MRSPESPLGVKDAGVFRASMNPLGKDSQIMPMATQPTRTPYTGVPGRTAPPDIRPVLTPTPDKRGGKHKVRNIILGTVVGAGAITSGGAAYDHHVSADEPMSLPGITRDITAIPGQIADWFKFGSGEVPPFFDNTQEKGVIKSGVNTKTLPEKDLINVYQEQSKGNKDNPIVIFPIKFTAAGQEVGYAFKPVLDGFTDSQTGKPITIPTSGALEALLTRNQELIVPAGNAKIFQFKPNIVNGQEYFAGFYMTWEQNGEIYYLAVSGSDTRTFKPLVDTRDIPVVTDMNHPGNGKQFPLLTVLANVDLSNPDVYLNFFKYNPKIDRRESIKPTFVTEGPEGQEKLLVTSN